MKHKRERLRLYIQIHTADCLLPSWKKKMHAPFFYDRLCQVFLFISLLGLNCWVLASLRTISTLVILRIYLETRYFSCYYMVATKPPSCLIHNHVLKFKYWADERHLTGY